MLSTFTWSSGATGNYSDSSMWTGPGNVHAVPGPADDAIFPQGNYTVLVLSNGTVNSVNAGAGTTFNVAIGTFTVTNSVGSPTSTIPNLIVGSGAGFATQASTTTLTDTPVISGNLNASAGATLAFNDSGSLGGLQNGTTLTGAGTFLIQRDLRVLTAINAPTNLVVDSLAAVGIEGSGTITVPSGSTFRWKSGTITGSGASINVAAGGNLTFEGAGNKVLPRPGDHQRGHGDLVGGRQPGGPGTGGAHQLRGLRDPE